MFIRGEKENINIISEIKCRKNNEININIKIVNWENKKEDSFYTAKCITYVIFKRVKHIAIDNLIDSSYNIHHLSLCIV